VPPLLINDVVVQVLVATLWTFSTQSLEDGALLLSASLEVFVLRHHWRIKGWRYSQAAGRVCVFAFSGLCCCVCCVCCDVENHHHQEQKHELN
jgi:hypothetical protein